MKRLVLFSLTLLLPGGLAAQTAQSGDTATAPAADRTADADAPARPATITPADYDRWERLGAPTLSHEGDWLAYGIRRVDDDPELRIRRVDGDSLVVITHGTRPVFSADDRWLAYAIGVSEEERERLRERDERVRNDLGLLDLASGDTAVVEDVASFAFSDDGRFLAMRRYPAEGSPDDVGAADLVVRELASGVDTRFGNVAEYAWRTDGGPLLAMAIDAEDDAGNGVQLYHAASGALRTLESRPARYTELGWRHGHDDLAVLRARFDEDGEWEDTTHVVLAWTDLADDSPQRHAFDPDAHDGFPAAHRIVDDRTPQWAEDGGTLFFGIKEREREPADEGDEEPADSAQASTGGEPADSAVTGGEDEESDPDGERPDSASADADEDDDDVEPADVLVWHAADVDIIPRQEVTAERDRRENHLAAWHLDEDRFVRLGTERTESVRVLKGGRRAVGLDETPHERDRMFEPAYRDLYIIDVGTGERERVKERVQFFRGPSPGGRYLLYLEDDHYFTYDVESDRHVRITEGLPTSFVDLEDDHTVEQKPPFGVAGWTEDDRDVLLYDEHDLWRVRPDGSEAERLTDGADGGPVRYRYLDLEREEGFEIDDIDLDAPLYLSVYDDWTEEHGFARLGAGSAPERLVWRENDVDRLVKAEEADVYLYRVQSFDDSPDYFAGGPGLADARRVTETNPFQADYAWGRSELVDYESARGDTLQGALFYPADYEPGRTYPMIVYIYETRSPSARSYVVPTEENPYNTTIFTSEGYFVFQPDIVYRDRNPGVSAIEAIVPAVERVLETGMIDPDRLGLVGHSWGGYQTTFAVTQTDIFRAAVAGAPLTNLVSMYNSIYWRTGGTDARIFEISQGRMEVPPWEDMDSYTRNSPLHNIENMRTPLLMAFGTDDGAVEFNQGVEFYNAARRADKDLVLLVYDDENHGISKEDRNTVDYHRRVKIWFAHHLKGEPAPEWITDGVPYLEQMEWREKESDGGGERPST